MNDPHDPDEARQILAVSITKEPASTPAPLSASIWIAMSCLQKAVRRGREDLALRAAATLIAIEPDRLWRRCAGIVFEDVGAADLRTISLVMAALTGKKFRATVGGDWAVARFIVTAMCRAPKCRAADDLLMTSEAHPRYERARTNFATMSTPDLLRIATGCHPVAVRAIATSYSAGTGWWNSKHLRPRRGEPSRLFGHLRDRGFDPIIVGLAEAGFKRGAGMLAPLVTLLSPLRQTPTITENEPFPPAATIGDVPGWALDIYSREGRCTLEAFLKGDSPTATWVRDHLPPSQRVRFLGGVLFRVEGGLVNQRLRWEVGDELRKTMDVECHGRHCSDATEVLRLMRDDIPVLNEVRAHHA